MQKEESSFSEEKEAKRLLLLLPTLAADTFRGEDRQQEQKFFGSFLQERTPCLDFFTIKIRHDLEHHPTILTHLSDKDAR